MGGFGDMYPISTEGQLVGIIAMVVGTIITALPISIIGSHFNEVWEAGGKGTSEAEKTALVPLRAHHKRLMELQDSLETCMLELRQAMPRNVSAQEQLQLENTCAMCEEVM